MYPSVQQSRPSQYSPFRRTEVALQKRVFKPSYKDHIPSSCADATGLGDNKSRSERFRKKSIPRKNAADLTGILKKSSRTLPAVHTLSPFKPFHVLVLGGGISGLVAAYTLKKRIKWPCKITLLEKSGRVGGWIHSDQFSSGSIFERGTRSIRPVGKVGRNTLSLVSELGLEDQIIVANERNSKERYIYAKGKVVELPNNVFGLFRKLEPLNGSLLPNLLKETMLKPGPSQDTTVYDFFERRFGTEVATYLGDAFCMGIYGCSSKRLSIKATFPKLWEYDRDYGSVILGGLLSPREEDASFDHPLCQRARKEKWSSYSLRNGLGTLPEKLHQVILKHKNVAVNLSTKCKSLVLTPKRQWICTTNSGSFLVDHVMSAIPSYSLAPLVQHNSFSLAKLLDNIKWTTLGVVSVEYERLEQSMPGFGILTPGCEGRKVIGIVYDSMVFPSQDRSPYSRRYTVMIGGDRFETLFGKPSDCDLVTLKEVALNELVEVLGIREKPQSCIAYINQKCIPQYELGHLDTVEQMETVIRQQGIPLTFLGNSYRGVSVNDIIYNTQTEVEKFVKNVNHHLLRLGCL